MLLKAAEGDPRRMGPGRRRCAGPHRTNRHAGSGEERLIAEPRERQWRRYPL